MRIRFALLLIGLLTTAGLTVACSSGEPVPDDRDGEAPEYEPAEGAEYDQYENDGQMQGQAQEQPGQQPQQPQQPGQQPQQPQQPGQQQPGQQPQQPGQQPQQGTAELPEATGPVATVNGEQIPAEEFNQQVEQLQQQAARLPPQYVSQMQQELLNQLIQKKLLDQAIDEADIEVTDQELEERRQELRRQFEQTSQAQFDEEMDFEDFVDQMGMSAEELDEVIEETVAIEKLLERRDGDMPTDEDVRQFYDDNPEMFTEPEHIEARQLVISVPQGAGEEAWNEARQTADEVRQRLTGGDDEEAESFEDVAADYENVQSHEAPIARQPDQQQQSGQQPQQPRQPEAIEEAAFEQLEDGEISEPIRTRRGWVLIERISHNEEAVADFEEVEEQLEYQLTNQAMQEQLDELLTELENDAEVQRHTENIE